MTEPILGGIAVAAAGQAVKSGLERIFSPRAPRTDLSDRIDQALGIHLKFVNSWSSRIQIFGMTSPHDTKGATVPLELTDLPRRFRSGMPAIQTLSEAEILQSPTSYQIVGDPGSGKTTTMKRIASTVLTEAPGSDRDRWAYPVVIVCRDVDWSKTTLADHLCSVLGFRPSSEPGVDLRNMRSSKPALGETSADSRVIDLALMAAFLDGGPAILIVDGLDEVPTSQRWELEKDIAMIADQMASSKVLFSCRSGSLANVEGFSILELCPLAPSQVESIAQYWLVDSGPFLDAVRRHPAADLVNRPLFLAQLLVVYRNSGGDLPDQPAVLYRRITRLMLQDWDESRRVVRTSAYANFHVDEKLEFLAAVAFELTVTRRAYRFATFDIAQIYERIAPRFSLPLGEARQVAHEIETHTGLIVESGDMYEFSHLSLQEYLCGYYLVRESLQALTPQYIAECSEEVAVAAALSSDPSEWISSLVLNRGTFVDVRTIGTFVRRLGLERPRFGISPKLGFALLQLMFKAFDDVEAFAALASLQAVTGSVRHAAAYYSQQLTGSTLTLTPLTDPGPMPSGLISTPTGGKLSMRLFELMLGSP